MLRGLINPGFLQTLVQDGGQQVAATQSRVLAKRERDLYEKLLKEKERVIIVLSDQVDLLRQQPSQNPPPFMQEPMPDFNGAMDMQAWVSEEEQDLRAMVEGGKLTKEEADAAFVELTGDIEFN